jgi:hypothetical protein
MVARRVPYLILAVLAVGTFLPVTASAQQASGIAGLVRDTSGAVLPGVTVEAASPALIEKVRTVVTDGEGRYSIVDLRPGTYVVTFTLTGFNAVRRDGIDLPGGFTATVNSEMQVGALEETITVTGAAPLVDVQSVRRQNAASDELLAALPSGLKNFAALTQLTPGLTLDTTGSTGTTGTAGVYRTAQATHIIFHGKQRGVYQKYDGMTTNVPYGGGAGGSSYVNNAFSAEEMTVETGGGSADSNTSNVSFDMIPKEGGNRFSGLVYGHYTSGGLQASNLTDELRARGLTTASQADYLYDSAFTWGGPLKRDRLWFFTAHRGTGSKVFLADVFYNKTHGTPLYTPDPSRPGFVDDWFRSNALRLTWQASDRNKVNIFADNQHNCSCRNNVGGLVAAEVISNTDFSPLGLYQTTWSSPFTNRLLFEAGASYTISYPHYGLQPEVKPSDIPIRDLLTGISYNAATQMVIYTKKYAQRFSASYVTGSHAFKAGVSLEEGSGGTSGRQNGNVSYQFRGPVPAQIQQFATPTPIWNNLKADLGIYAQDRWIVRRATLNLGLRFDYYNTAVPAQHAPAGPWVPERNFGPVSRVPVWKDLQPRLGVAYDLFGDGRTALKAAVGRYNGPGGFVLSIANGNNPMVTSVNSVARGWTDADGDYVPDCDLGNFRQNGECGQISDLNFGQLNPLATQYANDVLEGWGIRDYTWDVSAEIQHQLNPGISLTGAYFRNWYGNFTVTDNREVTPADFGSYCITAPADTRLPGGGGYQVCGLADVAPARFGRVTNLVTQASNYGKQTQVSDFFSLTANGRVGSVAQFGGGIDTGRTVSDRCFVVDSPQELLHCRVVTPMRANTQLKVFGSYQLPGEVVFSGILQNMAGQPILASYAARNAEIAPSLGRNLSACGTLAVCTATATVPLITPGTEFEGRRTHLDLRVSKIVRLGSRMRLQANLDVYNVLNRSDIQLINTTFGPNWRRPTSIMEPRLAQLGGQLTF